ncbi:PREDICTED: von Willebrand factor A domain-containing protein 2-like [Priapulus caudatus]|uniref:von Willebrand factor A domain-containing protein 2-like n=1 Tax=Priapulus caudatus TaxID=37621 RepID=A0ABM1EAI6_PRICU|nr:PREDICTED: von Willebrand factor A domain-containing protein 2-like [Priapulus caudatus]
MLRLYTRKAGLRNFTMYLYLNAFCLVLALSAGAVNSASLDFDSIFNRRGNQDATISPPEPDDASGLAAYSNAGSLSKLLNAPQPVGSSGCEALAFVLDASSSVGRSHFQTAKDMSKTIVTGKDSSIPIGDDCFYCLQIATVVYSHLVDTSMRFGAYSSARRVLNAIDNINYHSGRSTRTGDAMQQANREYARTDCSERTLVIVTDGKSNSGKDPCRVARQMKRDGCRIYRDRVGT